eukprot:3935627-Rhodomonas_salina.1
MFSRLWFHPAVGREQPEGTDLPFNDQLPHFIGAKSERMIAAPVGGDRTHPQQEAFWSWGRKDILHDLTQEIPSL